MINYFIYFIVFLLGLAIGSFLNVLIFRLPRGEEFVVKPSHCMACGNKLMFYDLVPVFSYLLLKGKCRYCGEKISIQYPLVELFTAISMTLVYFFLGWHYTPGVYQYFPPFAIISLIAVMTLIGMFITIFVIDLRHYIIPNEIIIFGIITGVIFAALKGFNFVNWNYNWSFLSDAGLGFLAGGLSFLLIVLLGEWIMKAEAMGMGDVKLMAVVGLFLGLKLTVLAMLLSFIIGSVISVFLLITKKKGRKDQIPFGPFIVLGSITAMIWGEQIISWYLRLGKFQ